MSEVLDEVRGLIANGCREIVLTGIETASYGKDLENTSLADLLIAIDQLDGIGRVRLGSLDPSLLKPAFVQAIAPLRSLCPHFHISMQSGSSTVLARMKRKYNAEMALRGMELLRDAIPHVQFTTDIILGFPHEGEAEFQETLDFIEQANFLMIHAFPYSKRKGTPAAEMDDQVPESVRHDRVRILSAKQREIRRKILLQELSARPQVTVLFEDHKKGFALGHTDSFVPVRIPADTRMQSVLAHVLVESADDDGLIGHLI